jgi:UDP-N-acetylmuramoyl-L-alanyl-D-glutamate--2,6-diaminopimelate ligase
MNPPCSRSWGEIFPEFPSVFPPETPICQLVSRDGHPADGDGNGGLGAYFDAKCRLFDGRFGTPPKHCAVNRDDGFGRILHSRLRRTGISHLALGTTGDCDLQLVSFSPTSTGSNLKIRADGKTFQIRLPLLGRFNALNALGALAMASPYAPMDILIERLATLPTLAGLLNSFPLPNAALAFVAYAHTPRALEVALAALREHFPSTPLAVVFGCGGDRDRGKRPAMARVSECGADLVIVTANNPRSERVEDICAEICGGFSKKNHRAIPDRRSAIWGGATHAIAKNGILLIAGNGHERHRKTAGKFSDFSDEEVLLHLQKTKKIPRQ